MIVAIDGPAGSGKSTIAKLVAGRLGFHYLDTGAMYRAVAFRALQTGAPLDDEARVAAIARSERIDFEHETGEALPTRVLIGGEDVTPAIRTPEVDSAVSAVASMPSVREAMVEQQRALGSARNIVVEGRDIGTVVFPDAEVKVFLTASPAERARRRTEQQAAEGHDVEAEVVHRAMERRDMLDSTREVAPLARAEDAESIDSTGLSIDEVVDRVVSLVQEARP